MNNKTKIENQETVDELRNQYQDIVKLKDVINFEKRIQKYIFVQVSFFNFPGRDRTSQDSDEHAFRDYFRHRHSNAQV